MAIKFKKANNLNFLQSWKAENADEDKFKSLQEGEIIEADKLEDLINLPNSKIVLIFDIIEEEE